MRVKVNALKCVIVMALAVLVSMSVQAQSHASQTGSPSYDVTDDQPTRAGSPWYRGTDGDGYGSNNFVYTYVRGATNAGGTPINSNIRARWTFTGVPEGECEVSVYVPSERATGDATYHFYENQSGNYTKFARLDQGDHAGSWTRLTTLEAEGGEVRIYLRNYPSRDQHVNVDTRGFRHNRIAADAMRVRCEQQESVIPSIEQYIDSVWHGDNCNLPTSQHNFSPENYDTRGWYTFYVGECTSWVQFRLRANGVNFHNGYPNSSPPSQEVIEGRAPAYAWGDAKGWDDTARAAGIRVNGTPQTGSVAQWEPRQGGAGSLGHVAYVEEVRNDGATIVVSELNFTNWRNGTRTAWCERSVREIDRGTNRWPTNFIHF